MDFVSDSLANGRRIKCLTVADDFSHESVVIAMDDLPTQLNCRIEELLPHRWMPADAAA